MEPYDNSEPASSGKLLRKREEIASIIVDLESASQNRSQRQFAAENGIPRTTLQHWLARKRSLDSSPALIEFFESPEGIAFLHRMLTAAHFEFCENGPASIHNVANFLKLCKLEPFIAASYPSQRKIANKMDKAIVEFGDRERDRLVRTMPEKWITLCEDETFHPDICMVAMEPVSNLIVLEEYVERRDGRTWDDMVGKALRGLPVKVVQVASDEAKGLVSHTEKGLGANHSPDVFHVRQEIGKGTSGPLAGQIKKAEKQVEVAAKQTMKEKAAAKKYDDMPKRPRGRRPNFEKKIAEAENREKETEVALDTARQNRETVRTARREIGGRYHPYDPETGEKQGPESMSALLGSNFETIDEAIGQLPDRCKKRVEKARRVVKSMVANIAFFFVMIDQYMKNKGIGEDERKILDNWLIPGFYLKQAARKEKDETRKEIILEKAEELLSIRNDPRGPLAGYCDDVKKTLARAAKDCADLFQRSSSCVEGRNARLSLRHHGIHRLSAERLQALTVVHDYHVKNVEGETPAQRFFESRHEDLFEWLLDNMDYPARPRKRFSKAA